MLILPLGGNGYEDAPSFGTAGRESLRLCEKANADLKIFRICRKALQPAEQHTFGYVPRGAEGDLPFGYVAEFTFDEGVNSKISFSGEQEAEIECTPERLADASAGIWRRIERLIGGFALSGQADYQETATNEYEVTFDKGTDFSRITGRIITLWPDVEVTYNGSRVDGQTVFDFTHPVELAAKVRFTVHDATIGIDGKDIMTDASGSATTELPNGVYPFTVSATGYEEFAGTITVNDADVDRAVELHPTFRVIFTVKSGTTNIRDAKIQISNQTLQTDSFGEALINLPNGTYTYSVAKSGFRTEEGQVKVEGAEVAVDVQLKQLYRVVFRVLDGNGIPLPDAAIAVDAQQITTDAEGVAPVYLPNGDYAYTVRKDGYDEATGSFTVAGAAQTLDVGLVKRIPPPAEHVVTFMIVAKGKGVPGATVTLGNDVQTTDSTGSCAFKLRDSTYTYTVRKAGYGDASGSFTVAGAGGRVVVALAEEGGVEPDAVERGQLAAVGVAPNPFTDELVLTNAGRVQRVLLVNALGVPVYAQTLAGVDTVTLPVPDLSAGVYILQLEGQSERRTVRLVKR